jgi:hypothetical protein
MKRAAIWLILTLGSLSGCAPTLTQGGEDLNFLQDIPAPRAEVRSENLLPLTPGNFWTMRGVSGDYRGLDKIVVGDSVLILGHKGTMVQLLRDGSLWRQEVYQQDASGLRLIAFGEKKADILQLDPPMQLLKPTFREGDEISWSGKIHFQKKIYSATGFCRVSSQDSVQTPKGRFQTYRLDSVIAMSRDKGTPLFFPAIRWLSRDIGFIRRSFADGGKPVVQELDSYMVKDK